ncbi:uncharacterized [Tachysurus ichikawai]
MGIATKCKWGSDSSPLFFLQHGSPRGIEGSSAALLCSEVLCQSRMMDKITDSTECNFSILSAIDPAERMTYPVSALHPDVLIIFLFLLLSR